MYFPPFVSSKQKSYTDFKAQKIIIGVLYIQEQISIHEKSNQISLVFDLEIILIFHPHYHTHSGNTSMPVNLAVVRWLVSYEDENEYDNGNEIED